MKYTILILIALMVSSTLLAQNNLQFSPEKPLPGDVVKFTYTPPANVFEASDVINCVVYLWGSYDDEFAIGSAKQTKPLDIVLKKNGATYVGEVPTDKDTRMLSFLFSSGDVKWKRVDKKLVLTGGKVDDNSNMGYAISFFSEDGQVLQNSHFFKGQYLLIQQLNYTGIYNPDKAAEYLMKELENWPDSKYEVYMWLSMAMVNDKETFNSMAAKEMEKLFATGLETLDDLNLVVTLSGTLKLKAQARYFFKLATEKFGNEGLGKINALWDEYAAEKDLAKKEEIMNQSNEIFNELSYNDKFKLAFSAAVPLLYKAHYLQVLANNGRLDDYKRKSVEYNLSPQNNPYLYSSYKKALDSLNVKGDKSKAYVELMAKDYFTFYSDKVSKMDAGIQLPAMPYNEYFSKADRRIMLISGAAMFADLYGQVLYEAGDYKKGFQYAKRANGYIQMLSQPPYDVADYNNRYSLLAEKVLPANECKFEIEKMVATGAWKSDMIDILNRIYVQENKSEDGFKAYISGLKQSQNELLEKTLKEQMVNEPAPDFSLTDMDGKTVNLSDFKGKTVILDFWATWCGPCIASFPAMNELIEANKNNPDLKILFVDTFERFNEEKENKDKVVEFMTANNYPFHVVCDFKSEVSKSYKVTGIPTKCIVDKNGNLRYRIVGAELNEAKLIDEINAMIETIK